MPESRHKLKENQIIGPCAMDVTASILAAGILRWRANKLAKRAPKNNRNSLRKDLISTPQWSVHGDENEGEKETT